jgi:NAD(P)-dependent dehydrogenase (short-subunit alcohol dehydrogenase family)
MTSSRKTALVTGATSGLGRETAVALGREGFHVIVHGRDGGRAQAAADAVRAAGGDAEVALADLASLSEVAMLAEKVAAEHSALDVLVNNAGVGGGPPPHRQREVSPDGHELRFAVNYLAPALLSRLLLPQLSAARPARIVNVGSIGQDELDFSDLGIERGYDGAKAYCRSKFALATFTFVLAREIEGDGVTVNCVHPANYMDTFQVREAGIRPWTSAASGVPPVLNLAVGPAGGSTGGYYDGVRAARAHRKAYKDDVQRKLAEATAGILAPYLSGARPGADPGGASG